MLRTVVYFIVFIFFLIACTKEPPAPAKGDLESITYEPQAYTYVTPIGYPKVEFLPDNAPTVDGIQLGRKLFYDPILSADSTQGCFSCHQQEKFFTDGEAFSTGIDGKLGKRSSMSIVDAAFHTKGLFWDGRAESLEDQAKFPVEDLVELHFNWPGVETRLKRSTFYPELFRKAFGIKDRKEITQDLVQKAIAQFERTIVSSGNSKYDQVKQGKAFFDADELDGYTMFFDLGAGNPLLPDVECAHCHNEPLFTTVSYFNNGMQLSNNYWSFNDLGYGKITNDSLNNGKMKAPTLRNLKYTAPYMHDGSLKTIDDVIEHYSSGGHYSPNKDPLIKHLNLNAEQKRKIKAFLNTLEDKDVIENPAFANPFK